MTAIQVLPRRCGVLVTLLLYPVLVLLASVAPVLGQSQSASTASASVPYLVKFSGTVKDAQGVPRSGVAGITFTLYKDEQGGTPLWLETQNVQADSSGHYTVYLGSTRSSGLPQEFFVSGEARWLGVQAEGQAEQPRTLLVSVPYALKAGDAQTVGGLPPSAFVLATPSTNASSAAATATVPGASAAASNLPPAGGINFIPLFTDNNGTLGNSAMFQSGSGASAKVGINTTTPAATLDVKGTGAIRGSLSLPPTGSATASAGRTSQPLIQVASSFNSGTNAAVNQSFRWQAEPAGNNTATPSGTLNLLFQGGAGQPAETGLKISNKGVFTFADGQVFPGTGTITGVTADGGLIGGGTTGNVTVALTGSCGLGQILQWNTITWICANVVTNVTPGTDLTESGSVGNITLNVDTTQVPQLHTANTFTGNQTVNGNLTATGTVTGNSFQIGSNLFGFGSFASANAFLGFGGSVLTTGTSNTAVGTQALVLNGAGSQNTAIGSSALLSNTSGSTNTAIGTGALNLNSTGSNNTASGAVALQANTNGSFNTADGNSALFSNTTGNLNSALGYLAGPDAAHGNLNNSTAIGSLATVTASNSMVLGSIAGVNGAGSSTNVGIGTTAPAFALDVHGTGNFTGPVTFSASQTFPNTVSGVTAGTDLIGGGTSGNVTLNVDTTKIVTGITAGTGLTGGGTGGALTLSLDTTKVPQLNTANSFVGNQSVTGNVTATGSVSGSGASFTGSNANGVLQVNQIGSALGSTGIYGSSTSTSGTGVYGTSSDSNGFGVEGFNTNSTKGFGVGGFTNSTGGVGVWGEAYATTGTTFGVQAVANSPTGYGLFASNTATGGTAAIFEGAVSVLGGFSSTGTVTGAVVNATSTFNLGGATFASGSSSSGNVFLGFAGNSTATGLGNTATGVGALLAIASGKGNTATGISALSSDTTGLLNTAVGQAAMLENVNGSYNTAVGYEALLGNTMGVKNVGIGFSAGSTNITGTLNTAVGYFSGQSDGLTNATAIGANAQAAASNALVLGSINGVNGATASTNVGIGTTAPIVQLQVQGNDSTGTGVQTLTNNTSIAGNSFAVSAVTSSSGVTTEMVADGLGTGPMATPSGYFGTFTNQPIGFITANALRMFLDTSGKVGINTSTPDSTLSVNGSADKIGGGSWGTFSDRRLKTLGGSFDSGLSQVMNIHPIRYRYKEDNAMGIRDTEEHVGLVAQDVQKVIPEAVTENSKGYLMVNNDPIIWAMLNAIKEQQRQIRTQQRQIASLNGKVGVLETALRTAVHAGKSADVVVSAKRVQRLSSDKVKVVSQAGN